MAFRGNGANAGLYASGLPVGAAPCAIAIWYRTSRDSIQSRMPFSTLSSSVTANERLSLTMTDGVALERIVEAYNSAGGLVIADVTSGGSRGAWEFGLINIHGTADRRAWWGSLAPGLSIPRSRNSQNGLTSFTPATWDQLSLGMFRIATSNSNFLSAGTQIAHAMFFTDVVRVFQIEQLRRGADPRDVCPYILGRYWTLAKKNGLVCKVSGQELTGVGTLTMTDEFSELPLSRKRRTVYLAGAVSVSMVADDVTPSYGQSVVLTVAGLTSDTPGTIEVGTTEQTVTDWDITGGDGTVTFTYDGRTGNAIGVARNLTLKIGAVTQVANLAYITPVARSGFTTVTLSGAQQSDPTLGLSTLFEPDLVSGDLIEYETPVGDTITIDVTGQPSAGPSYVEGAPIRTSGYDVNTGLWSDLTFALNDTGIAPGSSGAGSFGLASGRSFFGMGYRRP